MDQFKKSFKHTAKPSGGTPDAIPRPEVQPVDPTDRREVFVKIDGVGSGAPEDPPSQLNGQFVQKQKASGGNVALDMDLEMDEVRRKDNNPSAAKPQWTGTQQRVSFAPRYEIEEEPAARDRGDDDSSDEDTSRHDLPPRPPLPASAPIGGRDGAEVLKCTSSSFQRRASMFRMKTKSRLDDMLPEEYEWKPEKVPKSEKMAKSGILKSGQFKSSVLGKNLDDDEDDPLFDEDLPEEYTKTSLNAMTVLQWLSLVLIVAALICSLSVPALERKDLWNLNIWKWEVLVLALICGRLLSGWGIRIMVFFIERNFLLRKRVLYFVYGLRKAVQNCIWLVLVLIAWQLLFDKKVEGDSETLKYVTRVLVCLLLTSALWMVKTLIIKVMASSFHMSAYFDRIREALFNQYVIEALSGPPLVELKRIEEDDSRFANEVRNLQQAGATMPPDLKNCDFSIKKNQSAKVADSGVLPTVGKSCKLSHTSSKKADDGIPIASLTKMNPNNVSAWNMKRLMRIVRHGVLSTLDEQILESSHEDENANLIRTEREAKAAARKIFLNVARSGSKYIYLDDVMRFMHEEEALKTMSLFEGSIETSRISKTALKNWLVNAFRDRRALALTLNDTKTAVRKLHNVVNIMVGTLIVVIWTIELGILTSKLVLFASSQLLLAAFVFGNTCKTVFEAIIFLFVMHPFDVGDRCEIDGVQMVVEEMNILTTIFLRWDNQKILYPNSVLATKHIGNYYRSPDMGDEIEFCIHICTPAEKIALIKQKIISFMENKKEHWYPGPLFVFKNVEQLNMVRFVIWPNQTINFQNVVERWERRALLVEEMVRIFREHDIQFRLYPIDINVCGMPAMTASSRVPSSWGLPSS